MQMFETQFKVLKMQADAMKSFAAAEAAELGPQIELYKAQMDLMMKNQEAKMKQREAKNAAGTKSGGSK
jgi:hypothetical protein